MLAQTQLAPVNTAAARAMDGVRRFVRVLRASNAESERAAALTAAQHFVLSLVAANPEVSLRDVAATTLTTRSTASEVVARLTARGFIARTVVPDDRRLVSLTVTELGREALAASGTPVQERLIAGLTALSAEQQDEIANGLEAWLRAAGFGDLRPSMFFEQ